MTSRRRNTLIALGAAFALALGLHLLFRLGRPGVVPPPAEVTSNRTPFLARPAGTAMDLPPEVHGTREILVVIFVDGLAEPMFSELLAAGLLPSVSRLLAERPAWAGAVRSTFPTSTAPAIPEFLAGDWSHHLGGMPDQIHALDRREGRLIRYEVEEARWDGGALTLFDRLLGDGGVALSYFEGYFPGASITVHDQALYLFDIAMVKAREEAVLAYDDRMVDDLDRRLRAAQQAPNLVFVRLGALDTAGHFYGPDSEPYFQALLATDRSLRAILAMLEENRLADGRSLYEAAHVVLFSDHGMEATGQRIDLDAALRAAGLEPYPTSDPRALLSSVLDPDGVEARDAVAVPEGSNLAAIYLRARGPEAPLPWAKLPEPGVSRAVHTGVGTVDLVARLLADPRLLRVHELSGPNEVTIHGRMGRLRVVRRFTPDGDWELAAFVGGEDPFGECGTTGSPCCAEGTPEPARCFFDLATWRARTAAWSRPELPLMVLKPFAGIEKRRPDLLVEAGDGFGFTAETAGDHGRYEPALLYAPLVVAGSRVDPSARPSDPRLIDLVPTLLPLFGYRPEALLDMDGEDLGLVRREGGAVGFADDGYGLRATGYGLRATGYGTPGSLQASR
jgi:hypothetical protein